MQSNSVQVETSIDFSKRIFSFEFEGNTRFYTFDLLQKEKVEWLKNVIRSLHIGTVSKYTVFFNLSHCFLLCFSYDNGDIDCFIVVIVYVVIVSLHI